jgi:hypothetical protein
MIQSLDIQWHQLQRMHTKLPLSKLAVKPGRQYHVISIVGAGGILQYTIGLQHCEVTCNRGAPC